MAGSINKVILVGHLGKDPEVRTFDNDRKVANFTMATSETYKDRDGNRQERTEWHNVSVWGPLSDIAERYLRKGSLIYVEGKLRTREYEKDGQKRYSTDIMVDTFTMLGPRPEGNNNAGNSTATATTNGGNTGTKSLNREPMSFSNNEPSGDDDLPF